MFKMIGNIVDVGELHARGTINIQMKEERHYACAS
jgi:hypothetical protein